MTCQFCNSPESIEGNGAFNCGSYRREYCGFRSAECQLGEKILKLTKERDELGAINELLVQKIDGLRAKVARFEEVPENTTKADLVQNCRVLSVERDCALKEIGELRRVIVELTAAGNCVEGDKMNLAMAIRNVGGTANVKWSTDNWNNAKDWDRRNNGTI